MAEYQTPATQETPTSAKPEHADILQQAKDRFKYCLDAQALNREDQINDLKFFAGSPDNGWQWDEKLLAVRQNDPNGARPCLTINKLPQHVRQITNEQRQNRPAIKVLPIDSKSDVEVADMLNGVVRHIEYQSDADTAFDIACESQVVMGEGYWRLVTEYIDEESFDQDIFIRAIPDAFSVYLDPDRKDPAGADSRYGFIVKDFPEVDFKAKYPKAAPINWDMVGRGGDYTHWYSTAEKKVKVAEYFYIEHEDSTLTVGDKTRTIRRPIVKWCVVTGTEVLDERIWAGKWIPIVMVIGNETWYEGNSYRSGLIRTTKDSQRLYNFGASGEAEQVGLANKAPYIGFAGQFEGHEDKWKNANTVNYPYLEVEAVDDGTGRPLPLPQRQLPLQVSTALQAMKMSASDDLKSETGQYNPTLGNNPQSQSGVALAREQAKSEIANFHYIDNLSRSIRHTGRMIVDLIPKIYDTRRIARILGEDGTADQVQIDPTLPQAVMEQEGIGKLYNPSLGRYDVAVIVAPSYTTQRQEAAQMLVELAQGATDPVVQISMRYLAIKSMDFSGAQEMAEILKKLLPPGIADELDKGEMTPEQAQAMVMQMKQTMEQKDQQVREAAQALEQEAERIAKEREALTQLESKVQKEAADFQHAKELALKDAELVRKDDEIRKKDLEAKSRDVAQQEASAVKAGEDAAAKEEGVTASTQAIIEAIQESSKAMVEAIGEMMQHSNQQLAQLIACERKTELEFDETGNPVSSRSRMVLPEQQTIQ